MDNLRASFDEERYPNRYLLEVPNRQGRKVFETIKGCIAERGLDARVTYRENSDNGTLTWDIGIATTTPEAYAKITQHLDHAIHGWVMDQIDAAHGEAHPLNRYLKQLERDEIAPDLLRDASAEFSAKIETQRRAAIEAAYRDFETVRAQWAKPDAPHFLLE